MLLLGGSSFASQSIQPKQVPYLAICPIPRYMPPLSASAVLHSEHALQNRLEVLSLSTGEFTQAEPLGHISDPCLSSFSDDSKKLSAKRGVRNR